jgi:Flp pilus assembly protein TadD
MKTKEIAVTLPLAVLLYEIFFFRGKWKKRLLYLLPLLATLPIVPISVFATGDSAGDVLADIGEKSRVSASMSRLDYLFTQFRVIVTYLRLLILPVDQNVDYDYPVYNTFFTPPVLLSFLLLAALFALAVYLYFATRRAAGPVSTLKPQSSSDAAGGSPTQSVSSFNLQPSTVNDPVLRLISFGVLWFFLALAVESSIIPIQDVIFEHRMYLPNLGAATVFAATLSFLAEIFFRQSAGRWFVTVAVLIITGLAVATVQRNQLWGSELRLWQDAAAKSPQKARTLNNFAVALEGSGRRADAAQVFSRAIQVDPTYYKAYYNLADLYLVSDQPEKSLPLLQTAIRMKPDFTEAYVKMGAALLRGGDFREVIAFLERNLDRVSGHPEAHFYLGSAYAFLGQRDAAQRQLAIIARLDANLASTLAGLLGRNSPHGFSHGRD